MSSQLRGRWSTYLLWEWHLGQLVTTLIAAPFVAFFWVLTGGPNGPHWLEFWLTTLASIAAAIYLDGRLPPPWNGEKRGSHKPSRCERQIAKSAVERMIADSGPDADPQRLDDARLLADAGFEDEALDLLQREIGRE